MDAEPWCYKWDGLDPWTRYGAPYGAEKQTWDRRQIFRPIPLNSLWSDPSPYVDGEDEDGYKAYGPSVMDDEDGPLPHDYDEDDDDDDDAGDHDDENGALPHQAVHLPRKLHVLWSEENLTKEVKFRENTFMWFIWFDFPKNLLEADLFWPPTAPALSHREKGGWHQTVPKPNTLLLLYFCV